MKLYHYTDVNALYSIFKNKELWATKASFLNDKDEIIHIKDLFIEENNKFINTNNERYILFIEKVFTKYYEKLNKNSYVLSFSLEKDIFNLWSYFSKSDGYCLGINLEEYLNLFEYNNFFKTNRFEDNNYYVCGTINMKPNDNINESTLNVLKNQIHTKIKHGKIIYDDKEKKKYILQQLSSYYSSSNDKNKYDVEFSRFDYLEKIIENILEKSIFFKKSGFKTEYEYRIVFETNENAETLKTFIHYRIKNGAIIPYIKINFDNLKKVVKEINVGPWKNKNEIKSSLKEFVNNVIDVNIDIGVSEMNVEL